MADLSPDEVQAILGRACQLKTEANHTSFQGKTLALLFEKPSLRTRVSFEVAMHQMGGHAIYLGQTEVGLGVRESIADFGLLLSRLVDGIACRTYTHENLKELARSASVPVVNALSDVEHPTQALADLLTVLEHRGGLKGVVIAYIGDGNNVASSLALGAAGVGAAFRIASPAGYELPSTIVDRASKVAMTGGGEVQLLRDPSEAVVDADVVYTDVWASMGQEGEAEVRHKAFAGYQVNSELLERAKPGAIFMHPMPAHYGEEVLPGFLEHPQSVAYDQAENKLYILKALLEAFLAPKP